MGIRLTALLITVAFLMTPIGTASAGDDEGNWRQGRIYYRMVCTACHKQMIGEGVSPMSRTIADWKVYMAQDKHDASGKTNPKVSYYTSQAYRESVKDKNKAAAKFIKMPGAQLLANVRAFLIHGAKDSDTPARCQ